jgi:hypothetical protein
MLLARKSETWTISKLRFKSFVSIQIGQFVSRGLEFHHQLNLNSFDFHVDAEGDEYATINHETQKKRNTRWNNMRGSTCWQIFVDLWSLYVWSAAIIQFWQSFLGSSHKWCCLHGNRRRERYQNCGSNPLCLFRSARIFFNVF